MIPSTAHATFSLREATVTDHGNCSEKSPLAPNTRFLVLQAPSIGVSLFLDEATWQQLVAVVRAAQVPDEVDQG